MLDQQQLKCWLFYSSLYFYFIYLVCVWLELIHHSFDFCLFCCLFWTVVIDKPLIRIVIYAHVHTSSLRFDITGLEREGAVIICLCHRIAVAFKIDFRWKKYSLKSNHKKTVNMYWHLSSVVWDCYPLIWLKTLLNCRVNRFSLSKSSYFKITNYFYMYGNQSTALLMCLFAIILLSKPDFNSKSCIVPSNCLTYPQVKSCGWLKLR